MSSTPEKFVVVQSNEVVEAEYSGNLTTRALKTAKLIIAMIKPEDKNLGLYSVKIDALKRYLGMKPTTRWGSFLDELDDIFMRLNNEPIKIQTGAKKYLTTVFIANQEVDFEEGTITFEIPQKLAPYLLELRQNYTSYLLRNIPSLRSSYSIRMYELLYQYRKIGRRVVDVDDLQKKVGSSYPLYGNFKVKVLKISQRELKKYTDIRFEYEEVKSGRKITKLEFYIYPNKPQQTEENPQSVLDFLEEATYAIDGKDIPDHILATLKDLGIAEHNIEKYIRQEFKIISDEAKRNRAIERCKTLEMYYIEKLTLLQQSKALDKENPAGFLIKALQEDWLSPTLLKDKKSKKLAALRKQEKKQLAGLVEEKQQLEASYNSQKEKILNSLIQDTSLFSSVYKEVMQSAGKVLLTNVDKTISPLEQYQKHPMLAGLINAKLSKYYPERFGPLEELSQKLQALNEKIKHLK